MPDATPAQIRAGIAAFLGSKIPSLNVTADEQTIANPPACVILQAAGKYLNYQVALGQQSDAYDSSLRLLLILSEGDVASSTVNMDNYLAADGSQSIPAAFASDPTCGGVCDYVVPVEAQWNGRVTWAGMDCVSAQIILDVGAE